MLRLVYFPHMAESLCCIRSFLRLEDTNQCGEASSPHMVIDMVIDAAGDGEENKKPGQMM
jgi:hypothetical protein